MFILALILLILELYSSILHEKIKSTVSSLTKVNRIDVDIRTQNDTEQQHVEETTGYEQPEEVDTTTHTVNSGQEQNIGISVTNLNNQGDETTEPENNHDEEEPKIIRTKLEFMVEPTIKHKLKIPISYGFVLIMAILVCSNVVILFLNLKTEKNQVVSMISVTSLRIATKIAPFWWILSHSHAKEFAINRIRQHFVNLF